MILLNKDNLIILNEKESNGFKVRTYIEKLPEKERQEREYYLSQEIFKIFSNILKKNKK